MLDSLHLNRLQRKVLLVVVVIIVVPVLFSGFVSAAWISTRLDRSIEQWVREAAQVNKNRFAALHHNHRLFAQVLRPGDRAAMTLGPGQSPVPSSLHALAQELGITLVQVYDGTGRLLYSSLSGVEPLPWQTSDAEAIVRIVQGERRLLAAVTRLPLGRAGGKDYQLILGTLFDKNFLQRLDRSSGLKTRLFYPRGGDFAKAFSEEGRPLRLRLPGHAFAQLQKRQEYFSANAEEGRYFGLYTPMVDSDGRVEAMLFSGLEHHGGDTLLTDRLLLTLTLIFLGIAFALVTGYFLSRIVVRPVQELHKGVLKVASQDFRAAIPLRSNDELGDLARAFNTMAERLREARDAERREFQRDKIAALGELSLAMAHEIRNPIGVINTAAQLLEKHRDAGRQSELVRMVREESQRLNHLLRDFQQLARHRRPEFALIEPIQPLEKAVHVMLAGCNDVRVLREYRHGHALVRADAELLQQAWMNLIRNALEAMEPGPSELLLTSQVENHELVLALEDSGPGIPVEMIGRLFEPFFTTKEQGTGLGLTIANTLVEANGGRLELAIPRGRGARLTMRLPLPAEGE